MKYTFTMNCTSIATSHLDLSKPLQVLLNGRWLDCEIGKVYPDKIGVYHGAEHIWVRCGSNLRNKKREVIKQVYVFLIEDETIEVAKTIVGRDAVIQRLDNNGIVYQMWRVI